MSLLEAISPTARALLNSQIENRNSELSDAHRDRLQLLNQRYERAIGDDGRQAIQDLIDAENLRWKLIQDSQPTGRLPVTDTQPTTQAEVRPK